MTPEAALACLETGPQGLSAAEAEARLEQYGPNELAASRKISPWLIFLRQFRNLLIVILIVATVVSFALGEHLDAWVILVIVLACAILGFVQEYRAERAAAALRKMAAPVAAVLREGREQVIPAREVAPGDLLVLHTGDKVAADARLLEAVNLMADEAVLTGESTPASKGVCALADGDCPVSDRTCMVFSGTVITYGRGLAVAAATGMATEFGRIAGMLTEVSQERTPLERRMVTIGRVLGAICLATAVGASLLGVWRGYAWLEMLIWGISLAVAAVPEALPAVVTGALAIGTTRMARKNAIIKRLPAVETMGCTTVICTDKTGTLTRNEMTVRRLFLDGRELTVTGSGYEPAGTFEAASPNQVEEARPLLEMATRISLLCNDAVLEERGGVWSVQGDPTEGALLVLGLKAGLDREETRARQPRVAEIPFDSQRKRMSTIHQGPDGLMMYLKGAPESLLPGCRRVFTGEGERPLTDRDRGEIAEQAALMAAKALRVLGLAYRRLPSLPPPDPAEEEQDLVWVGLAGLIDPPRPEARRAVAQCRSAGIRVIMVTGDHPDTAAAIAREIGLAPSGRAEVPVLSGRELGAMDDEALRQALARVSVFARVAPEHKLRLVALLKEQGEVVAMTGDGVNDAPALKKADIGVAMGVTGAEVTKETASMILADDNFATLVAAVEEGRAIFDNIKKYLLFLLSCNITEVLVLTGAFFIGLPLPLVALQILWVNLTTDGLPALALGVDPKAANIMNRPPRPLAEGVFNRPVKVLLAVISLYLVTVLIPLFAYCVYTDPAGLGDPAQVITHAQTMIFATLVLAELVNAFNCRTESLSLFTVGPFANKLLILSTVASLLLIVAVIEWEPLARLFHTRPLRLTDWLLAGVLSLLLVPVVEAAKWGLRRSSGRPA